MAIATATDTTVNRRPCVECDWTTYTVCSRCKVPLCKAGGHEHTCEVGLDDDDGDYVNDYCDICNGPCTPYPYEDDMPEDREAYYNLRAEEMP